MIERHVNKLLISGTFFPLLKNLKVKGGLVCAMENRHLRTPHHRCTISKDMRSISTRGTMRGRRYLRLVAIVTIGLGILLGVSWLPFFSRAPAALAHAFVIGSDPVD